MSNSSRRRERAKRVVPRLCLTAFTALGLACRDASTSDRAPQDQTASTGSASTTASAVSPTVSTSVLEAPPTAAPRSSENSFGSQVPPETTGAVTQQAAAYEVVIRDAYIRGTRGLPTQPGAILVDHPVPDAGRWPVTFSGSASGEPFAPGVLEELSRRLVDVPLLGVVASMEEALGPDYQPTATAKRPGLLVQVSPLVESDDGFAIGVEVGPPGGQGWLYRVAVTANAATIADVQESWTS
jgi:hypothetical protein